MRSLMCVLPWSRLLLASPVVLSLALPGCVTRGSHRTVMGDLDRVRVEQEALQGQMDEERARSDARADALAREIADREARILELERASERLDEALVGTQNSLMIADGEIARLQAVLGQQGAASQELRQRLDALAQVEQEVRERNRIYEDVLGRFQSLIDGGALSVDIRGGRMVIQLPQDVLFPSGSATLAADGAAALRQVGTVLAEIPDRRFQVEGHTDNVPIATERFPSNWELSSARALSVIRVLLEQGVLPESLSAAGYGEFQPVTANDTVEGRRRNRRIEIVMLPNLDVIATTPPL